MKKYPVLVFCIAAGYAAGFLLMRAPASAARRAIIPSAAAAPRPEDAKGTEWRESLDAARSAPAAIREESLLLWADSVPLSEVPRLVSSLDPRREFQALKSLMYRWARSDGPAAVAAWRGMKWPSVFNHPDLSMERGVSSGWSMMHSNYHAELGAAILRGWSEKDVEAARHYAVTKLKSAENSGYLTIEVEKLTGKNASGQESMDAFEKRVQADPAAMASEALKKSTPELQTGEVRRVLAAWMKIDPPSAASWFESLPDTIRHHGPAVNMEWPLRAAPPPYRLPLMTGLLTNQSDLKKAMEAQSSGGDPGQNFHLNMEGTPRALKFAATTAVEWAHADPAAAQEYLNSMTSPDLRGYLTGHVAGDMVQRGQTTQAIEAVNALPAEAQSEAFAGFAKGWAEVDAGAALAWSQRISDTQTRDLFLTHLLRATGDDDPGWALEQLLHLSASADSLKQDLLRRWKRLNPEAAQSWMQQHGG